MKFTGERVTPECRIANQDLFLWHISRYDFAQKYIHKNDAVLDIACGIGYGTYELAMLARETVGIDISDDAIEFSKIIFCKNIRWLRHDCTKTTDILEECSFDVITSF